MFSCTIEVRFSDLDSMGHVNNANFLTYLEITRTKFIGHLLDKKVLEPTDFSFILAKAEINFKAPIMFQNVNCDIWVSTIGKTSFEFTYKLYNDKTIFANATTIQVFYNYQTNSKELIPEKFKKLLEDHLKE